MKKQNNIKQKLFSIKTIAEAKIQFLQKHLHKLSFQEMTWLSRMEDFYLDKEYLTEKQIEVLNSLVMKHSKQPIQQSFNLSQ
jgi:hypothetical protein